MAARRKDVDWEKVDFSKMDPSNPSDSEVACFLMLMRELSRVHAASESFVHSESFLVKVFLNLIRRDGGETRIPCHPDDKVIVEYKLIYGRADIVIFHIDGSISVIEAKDANDVRSVVAGIGQVGMYASQINANGMVVRRCLLFNSIGNEQQDLLVENACLEAGVIPLSIPPLDEINRLSLVLDVFCKYQHHGWL